MIIHCRPCIYLSMYVGIQVIKSSPGYCTNDFRAAVTQNQLTINWLFPNLLALSIYVI